MATFDSNLPAGGQNYTLRLIVTQSSQNIAGNTSNAAWSLRIIKGGGTGRWADGPHYWSANIGGVTYSGSIGSYDFRSYSELTLASATATLTHNSSGYLTATVTGSFDDGAAYGNLGNATSTGSFTFTRIPKVPQAPGTPTVGTTTPTSVALSWTAPDNMGATITNYEVQRATNSGFTTGLATQSFGTSTSGTVTGLTAGPTYWFRVRAQNSVGYGSYSGSVSATPALPAPTLNSLSQNASGGLVASWSAPSVTTGLTGYRLQIATDSGFTTNVQNIDLGNVLTHTVTGLAGGRIYYARVAALTSGGVNTYSASRNHMLVLSAGDLDGWTRVGTKPANISYYTTEGIRRGTAGTAQALWLESLATGAVTLNADTFGIQKTVTGLVVGKSYRFEASATLGSGTVLADSYRITVVSETSASPVTVTTAGVSLGTVEFVADATSAVIRIMLAESVVVGAATDGVERVAFTGMKLSELSTDYPQRLRGTVYESNLANHFDLACNSVGASWYVAKDGVTRFRLPGAQLPVSAIFTDEPMPGAVSYVDIVAGFDTRSTVNRIEAVNYGVDSTGEVEENDELIVEDTASQGTYGIYRSTLAVNLYDVAPYDASFSDRLTDLLEKHSTPTPQVSQLRWNAQENLDLAAALEVGDRLQVRYRGVDYTAQIVSITHDIQPTRWMVTLNLTKE